ncbi:MAG: ATP-binding protein, partial [bacterium]
GRLAGGIAHDFNNYLGVIIGYSEMVLDSIKKDDPLYGSIKEIREAAWQAASLAKQLLTFTRKQETNRQVLNLNDVVSSAEKMLRRVISEDIKFESYLTSDLHFIKADLTQVEQILMNLAVNARDAMPKGGKLTIETKNVELGEEYAANHFDVKPGNYVMVAVTDSGCGMSKELQSRIFEPYFTTKEKGEGTGLGLAIVYGIVKQNGGHIWVYSEEGKGTTFKIYFPQTEETVDDVVIPVDVPKPKRNIETVLIVEDEDALRSFLTRIFKRKGYNVLEARHGGEALRVCQKHPGHIDLMVTDVIMPEMSGQELTKRIMPQRPGMKVLYMSGYTNNTIVKHGFLEPGTHFIEKPFSMSAIEQKAREMLAL